MNKRSKTSLLKETKNEYVFRSTINYPIIFEKNENGIWTVSCPVLPGCVSEGDTKEEASKNIQDAIQLYLRAIKKEMELLQKQHKVDIATVLVGV